MSTIDLAVRGDVAYLTITRPERRNALAWATQHELGDGLEVASRTPGVRFVVLGGAGPVFSSGGDRAEIGAGSLPAGWLDDYVIRMQKTVLTMRAIPQVVVAAVQGAAVGAGASLALAADVVVAEAGARVRFPFAHFGAVPDGGAVANVGLSAGTAVARDVLLTGRWLTAAEAQACGLISRICPEGRLDSAVNELLAELRQSAPDTLASIKRLINTELSPRLAESLLRDGAAQRATLPSTAP